MKFIDIKKEYLEKIKSHTETKKGFKNDQRAFSKGEGDYAPSPWKVEESCFNMRCLHVAYSLLKGTAREKIEKEIDPVIDSFVEKELTNMVEKLAIEISLVKDESGSILAVKRLVSHED